MKKGVVWLLVIACIFSASLFAIDKASSRSATARRAISSSTADAGNVGPIEHVILTMFSDKTGPTGKGCTTLSYFVTGARSSEWVEVLLKAERYGAPWEVVQITEGTKDAARVACEYG